MTWQAWAYLIIAVAVVDGALRVWARSHTRRAEAKLRMFLAEWHSLAHREHAADIDARDWWPIDVADVRTITEPGADSDAHTE